MTTSRPQAPSSSVAPVHQRWWNVALNLFFPPHCAGCRAEGSLWCQTCHAQLSLVHNPMCAKCGEPNTPSRLCSKCRQHVLQIEFIRSVAIFQGTLRNAIHQLKYNRLSSVAEPFGDLLADYWQANALQADWLVPVPLHPARERDRGYNQAALLAQRISDRTQIPSSSHALKRTRTTQVQMELKTAADRRKNVDGAFACADTRMRGKRIAIIDDVCTTGATLDACAQALHQAGAASVFALTLARTP